MESVIAQQECLDRAFVEDWLDRFLRAWNAHDTDAVVALCAEDVVWSDPSMSEPLQGRDRARRFIDSTFTAFPDFQVSDLRAPCLVAAEPRALAQYRMTGTMLGDWDELGFAATGARICVEGIDTYDFRGELLCGCRTLYDSLDTARQLGILPAAGSASDRLLARLQHVQARFQRRSAGRR
jgi:steroid delta-isomerase-like uncharacterized protein